MKKRFYSVNGQMMGYEEGGVKKDLLTDHLGSITAEIDQTQTRTYDTRYSAYGRNNWSTGTGCGFGWVGSYGYRETGLFHMSYYVRARHYSYVTGNWSTVDPMWPSQASYGYVHCRPTAGIDPSGKWCWTEYGGPLPGLNGKIGGLLGLISGNATAFQNFLNCFSNAQCQYPQKAPSDETKGYGELIDDMSKNIKSKDKKCPPDFEIIFAEGGWWPLANKCNDPDICMWTDQLKRPPRIHICQKNAQSSRCGPLHCQLAHELMHAIGFAHSNNPEVFDCVKLLPGCENYNPINIGHKGGPKT